MTDRVCYACGSHSTYISKKGNIQWFSNKPIGWLCKRCNNKYIVNPKWHPITNPVYSSKMLWFKDKQIIIHNGITRTGVCNICRAIKGQIDAKIDKMCLKIDYHHIEYHDDDPLRDTIEICTRCHGYNRNH